LGDGGRGREGMRSYRIKSDVKNAAYCRRCHSQREKVERKVLWTRDMRISITSMRSSETKRDVPAIDSSLLLPLIYTKLIS
jgi:hypothetical protein